MSATATVCPWRMCRMGIVMQPDPTDPREAGGVLNPAATRGPDGQLYLLPRLVAAGNYSRIGLARVVFNRRGDPVGVERLGVVLEPQAPYELNPRTGGGVEDARVTHLAARGLYVMTYTAYGPAGPRIAAVVSHDLRRWRRTGLVRFAPHHGIDLGRHPAVRYCAGALLLDGRDPRQVLYRSARSLLAPRVAAERVGAVADVVFPTRLDARPDGQLDVYYGMAESRIGVARACLANLLAPAKAA